MPTNDRSAWTDARLDDLYREFQRVLIMVERIGIIEANLKAVAADASSCRKNVHALRGDMTASANQIRTDLLNAQQAQVSERKSDRRWLIGTCLSTAALIIAAIGILAGHIG